MSTPWLASGGTFWILGTAWLISGICLVLLSLSLGKAYRQEADGCVLAIGTFVLMSIGGGVGLQIGPYPWFILSALACGMSFPGLLILFWMRKNRRR